MLRTNLIAISVLAILITNWFFFLHSYSYSGLPQQKHALLIGQGFYSQMPFRAVNLLKEEIAQRRFIAHARQDFWLLFAIKAEVDL